MTLPILDWFSKERVGLILYPPGLESARIIAFFLTTPQLEGTNILIMTDHPEVINRILPKDLPGRFFNGYQWDSALEFLIHHGGVLLVDSVTRLVESPLLNMPEFLELPRKALGFFLATEDLRPETLAQFRQRYPKIRSLRFDLLYSGPEVAYRPLIYNDQTDLIRQLGTLILMNEGRHLIYETRGYSSSIEPILKRLGLKVVRVGDRSEDLSPAQVVIANRLDDLDRRELDNVGYLHLIDATSESEPLRGLQKVRLRRHYKIPRKNLVLYFHIHDDPKTYDAYMNFARSIGHSLNHYRQLEAQSEIIGYRDGLSVFPSVPSVLQPH